MVEYCEIQNWERTLPLPRRTSRKLAQWLFTVSLASLSVLCLLHLGLLAASQTQQPRADNLIDAAIAEGKAQRDAGRPFEAIRYFARAADLARRQNDSEREARSLILLAVAQVPIFN